MPLSSGDKLGSYEILAAIGAGGMGEVYRARDSRLGRDVAVKVLSAGMAHDPERLARFQREARVVAALNHPQIVTIYSVEEAGGIHFLTMELVEGQSLDRLIPASGLPVERIVEIAGALADALAAAHEKGIVHRDLKPANVMVTHDGRVKVLDFGLAKDVRVAGPDDATIAAASQTQAGMVMGTPSYMSPEQISGRPLDHRTDIFSLGVVLHEMTTGKQPFEGNSSAELISAILRDTPPSVAEIRPGLPADLARIIRRCLEKNPRDRMQTARDVANEFRDLAREAAKKTPLAASAGRAATAAGSGAARAEEGFWVAVLPFKYSGGNADLTALGEGLTEDIVTGLSRFSYLRVIARGSTLRYANQAADLRTVGRDLGAHYVMEGNLRQAGNRLRVAVQLVDAITGAHLWAETYDRAFAPESIFDLQDDLVPRIVSTVADMDGILPESMAEAIRNKSDDQLSPLETLLRSFNFIKRITPEEHAKVRQTLETAVRKAPDHGGGWAMLSFTYTQEYRDGFNLRPDPLGRALAAANRAVELAPSNHLSYFALASTLFFQKDFLAFRPAAERAIELNPMDGSTSALMGHYIAYSGDWERGCAIANAASSLNPRHAGWHEFLAFYNAYNKGEYRDALDAALRMSLPRYFILSTARAAVFGQLGQREAAQKALQELLSLRPDFAGTVREELGKFFQTELVERLIDGLRKAGLEIADVEQPAPARPAAHSGANLAAAAPSIAVLPFANLSAEKGQEYFSDGLAEEIINLLTQVSGLKVIARASAFAFRGKEQDFRGIAGALGVGTVLQGSVRRAGSRIHVTAQLIDAADSTHLWSDRYDRELADVFAIQDEISAAIAGHFKVHFIGGKRQTTNIAAYEAFLEGRHHWLLLSPADIAIAFECYEKAVALDPGYAQVHVGISEYYMSLALLGLAEPAAVIPRIEAAARKALELDGTLVDAYGLLAHVSVFRYRWDEARNYLLRAMELSSGSAHTVHPYTVWYLVPQGRLEEALALTDRVLAQDPLSSAHLRAKSRILSCLGRHEEALEWSRRSVDVNPNDLFAAVGLAGTLAANRQFKQAIATAEQLIHASGRGPWTLFALSSVHALAGHVDEAHRVLEELRQLAPAKHLLPSLIATLHAQLGEKDAAFEWAGMAVEKHDPVATFYIPNWKTFHACDSACSDSRYPALLNRMNL